MALPIHVLYLGDQSVEPYNSLEDLFTEAKASILVSELLRSAFDALQEETSSLPPADRSLFVGRDFAELVEYVRAKVIRHAAVSSVLHCVAQLGWTLL